MELAEIQRRTIEGPDCWAWDGAHSNGRPTAYFNGRTRYVYRIIMDAPEGVLVRHTCDNPGCVRPDHLLLGTHKDNVQDMFERGRQSPRHGEHSSLTSLTEAQVRDIKKLLAKGTPQAVIAKWFDTTQPNISKIKTGASWAHVEV